MNWKIRKRTQQAKASEGIRQFKIMGVTRLDEERAYIHWGFLKRAKDSLLLSQIHHPSRAPCRFRAVWRLQCPAVSGDKEHQSASGKVWTGKGFSNSRQRPASRRNLREKSRNPPLLAGGLLACPPAPWRRWVRIQLEDPLFQMSYDETAVMSKRRFLANSSRYRLGLRWCSARRSIEALGKMRIEFERIR